MVAVRFKHALITFLLLFISTRVNSEDVKRIQNNPKCIPPVGSPDDQETHFMFFIDMMIEKPLMERLVYLLKAISCEIPVTKKIQLLVSHYTSEGNTHSELVTSDQFPDRLYKDLPGNSPSPVGSACSRFRRVLGNAPPAFLEKKNAQFIVPIFEDKNDPDCSFLKVFQNQYKNDPRKENFYFNGILINSKMTDKNTQSTRILIPNLEKAINTSRESLVKSDVISEVHESAHLVQSYASMIRDILLGNIAHDWEDLLTTTLPTSTAETTKKSLLLFDDSKLVHIPPSNSTNSSTTMDPTPETSNSSTTFESPTSSIKPSSSTPTLKSTTTEKKFYKMAPIIEDEVNSTTAQILGTSETSETTASGNVTTPEDSDYDADNEEDAENLEAGIAKAEADKGFQPLEATTRATFEADIIIYILILLLIIWIFCLFLCLVWMFYCAKKKKNKIESEAEAESQLLLPLFERTPERHHKPKSKSHKKSTSESDEIDDEWKNIKPSKYVPSTTSKSEIEDVKQPPPEVQCAPVEVSEFEDKLDDDVDQRPRHGGYVPVKKAEALRFD